MIPKAMISSLISERENRKSEAITEITSKWATAQTLGGPVLTVPYEEIVTDAQGKQYSTTDFIQFLPNSLEINGNIKPETRYRGIYKAILYNTKINIQELFLCKARQSKYQTRKHSLGKCLSFIFNSGYARN